MAGKDEFRQRDTGLGANHDLVIPEEKFQELARKVRELIVTFLDEPKAQHAFYLDCGRMVKGHVISSMGTNVNIAVAAIHNAMQGMIPEGRDVAAQILAKVIEENLEGGR